MSADSETSLSLQNGEGSSEASHAAEGTNGEAAPSTAAHSKPLAGKKLSAARKLANKKAQKKMAREVERVAMEVGANRQLKP